MTPDEWGARFLERLLASPDRSVEEFRAALAEEGASPLTPVLRPVVIDRGQRYRFEVLTRAWHVGMREVLRTWAEAPDEAIVLPPGVEARVRAEAREGRALGSTRYDFILGEGGEVALIECQAGDPSGMGVEEASAGAFSRLSCFDGQALERQSIASSLRRFVAREPAGAGRVVFVIHRDAFLEWDVVRLVKVFRAEGVDAVTADPSELRFDGEALRLRDERVSLVVRDSLEDLLAPERVEASRALMDAWAKGVVSVVNPIGSIVADHKVLLRRLRSPAVLEQVSTPAAVSIEASVPETIVLPPTGVPERQRWVLKPSDGFGGFDVTIGPAVSDEAWSTAVEAARASRRPFLLQRFAKAHTADFPVVVDGGLALRPHHTVYSAWMHGERFGGLFARVHQRPVVNVHQGGGLVPVYVLR